MKKPIFYLFSIIFVLFSYNNAQSGVKQDTILLDQVVITATRTPRQLKETPILTRVITSSDIAKYGRTKIEDILSTEVAGIEFHQAGYGTTMSFQGLDARHILVLIDGERIAGEVNGNIDFSRINPLVVERIEIMKGSSSVLYGSSAMGATINIITKEATDKASGAVQVKYGLPYQINSKEEGNNSNIPNLDIASYFSGKWGRVSSVSDIKIQSTDPYRLVSSEPEKRKYTYIDQSQTTYIVNPNGIVYVPIDEDGISVSGWKMLSVTEKIDVEINEKFDFYIKGGYFAKQRFDLNTYDNTESTTDTYNQYQGYNVDSEFRYNINHKHKLALSAHQNSSKQKEYSPETNIPKQHHQLFTTRLLYNFNHTKGELTAGVDYDLEKLNYDLTDSGFDERKSYQSISFYAQEELSIVENLDIVLGVRYLYNNFNNNYKAKSENGKNEIKGAFTPKFAITYMLDNTTIRANWSMGYRTPSLKERYIKYFQPQMGSWIVGNENLIAEQNHYASLSGEYFSPSKKLTFSAMAYLNFFKNKIDTYLNESANSYVYANTEQTRIIGIEFTGRYMVMNNWWLSLNYAYNHNEEKAPTNSAQYIFTSPHTGNINTSYRYKLGETMLEFTLATRYIGAKNYEDRMPTIIKYSDTPTPKLIFGIYEINSKGYFILDSSISATYAAKYKIMLGVDNMLNYRPKVASFNAATTPGVGGYISLQLLF